MLASLCGIVICMNVPDHEFVIPTAVDVVWICRCEDIVRHVRTNVGGVVRPVNLRWHTGDSSNGLPFGNDLSSVGIALYLVLTTLPHPISAPLDPRAGSALVVGALRTRRGLVLAPEVVEDFVPVDGVIGILRAEADGLLDDSCIADRGCSALG
jgi:hypothetical protein